VKWVLGMCCVGQTSCGNYASMANAYALMKQFPSPFTRLTLPIPSVSANATSRRLLIGDKPAVPKLELLELAPEDSVLFACAVHFLQKVKTLNRPDAKLVIALPDWISCASALRIEFPPRFTSSIQLCSFNSLTVVHRTPGVDVFLALATLGPAPSSKS